MRHHRCRPRLVRRPVRRPASLSRWYRRLRCGPATARMVIPMPTRILLLSVAAAGLLGGAGGAAVYAGIDDDPAPPRVPAATATATPATPVADGGALDAGTVYDRSK